MAILKIKGLRERVEVDDAIGAAIKKKKSEWVKNPTYPEPWIETNNWAGHISNVEDVYVPPKPVNETAERFELDEPDTPEKAEWRERRMAELREHMKNLKNEMSVTN